VNCMWPFNVVPVKDVYTQTSIGVIALPRDNHGLFDIMKDSGLPAVVVPDIAAVLRGKLLINLNNAVCTLIFIS
jgi:hypothetical protein